MTLAPLDFGETFSQTWATRIRHESNLSYRAGKVGRSRPASISKTKLLSYAADRIYRQAREQLNPGATPKTDDTLRAVLELLDYLLDDDSATPQANLAEDGTVTVEWLVAHNAVSISASAASDIQVWAEDSNGREIACVETTSKWIETPELQKIRRHLRDISGQVSRRVPSL